MIPREKCIVCTEQIHRDTRRLLKRRNQDVTCSKKCSRIYSRIGSYIRNRINSQKSANQKQNKEVDKDGK